MSIVDLSVLFPGGVLRPELFVGVVSAIKAGSAEVNLSEAGRPSGSHVNGGRYGRGEVGEYVLVEGQQGLLLGRVSDVRLREPERRLLTSDYAGDGDFGALGTIRLLGSVAMDSLQVTAGVEMYPRLGDRVYSAPHRFIAAIPMLFEADTEGDQPITLDIGRISFAHESRVAVRPERLFGRHCAILGATGGGKSWTTARIIQACRAHRSKIILLDATGEYRNLSGSDMIHAHLGDPVKVAESSVSASLPPTCFEESDFVALFEPAGKVQGPKLRAAIRSLRLADLRPNLAPDGFIRKINQPKMDVQAAEKDPGIAALLDDPRQPFDVRMLVAQIEQECVFPEGFGKAKWEKDSTKWGGEDGNFTHCLSLIGRINAVLTSPAFRCVFDAGMDQAVTDLIDSFASDDNKVLRICMSGIAHEYQAREIVANAVGRRLLGRARSGAYETSPMLVFVDEAHNFLGRRIGLEENQNRLDAFELIAKEGRKFGLNVCLATQRPRDVTEGVLSQMGTLVVHRLTNDHDRAVVERACGEIDHSASSFLPSLQPGEAVLIGTDFPIPLTVKVDKPAAKPESGGPDYQWYWQ